MLAPPVARTLTVLDRFLQARDVGANVDVVEARNHGGEQEQRSTESARPNQLNGTVTS